ncbi:DUF2271 domain-containing protein [Algibacillus agarilyticus]|uniref:DUF2271 domain-containing protein n=1 Tax=Algibacillus agarilyticus TaxID=2234133 RepID=UPI000DD009FF|nr:DUF2271 domain-containing protein [Algibacillus agarilyticus]
MSLSLQAQTTLTLNLTLPELDVDPYHKPYVAVWLETPSRQYVTTLTLWADDKEWYKDLRQWWRKAGRGNQNIDGVTQATHRPGEHTLTWNGLDLTQNPVAEGQYILNVEASREEGGREFIRIPITLKTNQQAAAQGKTELGTINLTLN